MADIFCRKFYCKETQCNSVSFLLSSVIPCLCWVSCSFYREVSEIERNAHSASWLLTAKRITCCKKQATERKEKGKAEKMTTWGRRRCSSQQRSHGTAPVNSGQLCWDVEQKTAKLKYNTQYAFSKSAQFHINFGASCKSARIYHKLKQYFTHVAMQGNTHVFTAHDNTRI
jgi:hypothetical protein